MLNPLRLSAFAMAVSMAVASQPVWAASSAELQLTNLQSTLTAPLTGNASTKALTLTFPTGNTFFDNRASRVIVASQWEPADFVLREEDLDAPVALSPPSADVLTAIVSQSSASASVQTSAGQTSIAAQGQSVGDGQYFAQLSFEQGNRGCTSMTPKTSGCFCQPTPCSRCRPTPPPLCKSLGIAYPTQI